MQAPPFRILSLSGGGVRGLFQAIFLKSLSENLREPLWKYFDLIAGTSTGALIALAVALEVDLDRVVAAYRDQSCSIFRRKKLGGLRRGPRYDSTRLRALATELLGEQRLGDCKTNVLVTATSLEQYRHRIFSTLPGHLSSDRELPAKDVALASSAAPTYFSPVRPGDRERAYVDGGLWANSPAIPAILEAFHRLQVPFERMHLLALGNGRFPEGSTTGFFSRLRPWSLQAIGNLFDLMFAAQASFAQDLAHLLLSRERVLSVDVPLGEVIQLDNPKRAIEVLPALAESEAERAVIPFKELFVDSVRSLEGGWSPPEPGLSRVLAPRDLIRAAGLTAFYPSRKYYGTHRADGASIDEYVSSARKRLVMVSINLMTGVAFDDLLTILKAKLLAGRFEATISLLDPEQTGLIDVMARGIGKEPDDLAKSIEESFGHLMELKQELPQERRECLRLRAHKAIPFGSAILLDHDEDYGRIQIETKPYRVPFNKSLGFEISNFGDNELYVTLADSYEQVIAEGRDITAMEVAMWTTRRHEEK
ncbi:MAG TPA: CBASS cGAMP-activated phospholipase [Thermoanaerobaculia bacterium]|nr:CBASS cGAMP-activated phospholipase [Thermoanaerobaculia bacterium]